MLPPSPATVLWQTAVRIYRQWTDRGDQQPRPGRKGQGAGRSLNPKPQGQVYLIAGKFDLGLPACTRCHPHQTTKSLFKYLGPAAFAATAFTTRP